jgi:sarcosine oxidase
VATYDVIVAGLGAAGSAAARALAMSGLRVLALDQFSPPHTWGSTHGGTRIIREAYFEGSEYVPLVQRAYERWDELANECGEQLFIPTGGMTIGPPSGALARGARLSAELHGIAHDVLSARDANARYPQFNLDDDMVAVLEHRAGVLLPEACVTAFLDGAASRGAAIHLEEELLEWTASDRVVRVRTPRGEYEAGALVLTAGAWLPRLIGDMNLGLTVERQVMHWFEPASAMPIAGHSPVTIWDHEPGRAFYTIPDMGQGAKAAFHHAGEHTTAATIRREVSDEEVHAVQAVVARRVPGLSPNATRSATCIYTNTPDENFLIDFHPTYRNVILASPCSGHGFKFAPVIGDMIAGLVRGDAAARPELFAVGRLMKTA